MQGSLEEGYPLYEVWGKIPERKNYLVNVYCNFIVNLDRSLQSHKFDGRSYVRVFFTRRKPSFRRECIAAMHYCKYCILRDNIVREIRESYNSCVVGCIPSFAR